MKLALILAILPALSLATDKPPETKPVSTTIGVKSVSASQATAASNAETGDAISLSHGGQGVGSVEVGADQNRYDSEAFALVLPGLVAAPAVSANCLRHTRGIGIASAGVTGGTKYDEACVDRQQCLAIADRLAKWGQLEPAIEQLKSCDKAQFTGPSVARNISPTSSKEGVSTAAAAPPKSECATKAQLDRAFTKCSGGK